MGRIPGGRATLPVEAGRAAATVTAGCAASPAAASPATAARAPLRAAAATLRPPTLSLLFLLLLHIPCPVNLVLLLLALSLAHERRRRTRRGRLCGRRIRGFRRPRRWCQTGFSGFARSRPDSRTRPVSHIFTVALSGQNLFPVVVADEFENLRVPTLVRPRFGSTSCKSWKTRSVIFGSPLRAQAHEQIVASTHRTG